jgi:molybdopterin synthase sulfur carrier subunit
VKVLYFAWIKQKIGVGEEDISLPATVGTVGALIEWLKMRSTGHAQALADLNIVRTAVNQDYVTVDHPVTDGDEVAFFPPVTGG